MIDKLTIEDIEYDLKCLKDQEDDYIKKAPLGINWTFCPPPKTPYKKALEQLANTMRENERLREVIEYIAGSLKDSSDETLAAVVSILDNALSNKESDNE